MKKRTKLLSFIIIIFSIVLIGCGTGDSEEGAANGERDEGNVVIWSGVTGPDGDLIQENINEYNETDPDYPVELIAMEQGTLDNRLVTAVRSGEEVPDLVLSAAENIREYSNQDLLVSWNEHIEGTELTEDSYLEEAWNVGNVDGEQFGMPVALGTWVMYYNQDLVDEYVPGATDDDIITYDEVQTAGENATEDGIVTYGFSWPMQNFNNLYLQMGGQFANEDGEPTIATESAASAVQHFKDMHDAGFMNQQGEDAVAQFMNGETIFLPEGTWMISDVEEITDFEWGQTFTPQWDENNVVQASGADQFIMLQDENRPEERIVGAIDFMEWLQDNQLTWLESGANTASLDMLDNEEYLEMPQSFLLETPEARETIEIITDEGSSYIFEEIDNSLWDMIEGNVEIEEELESIQRTVEDRMGQ